VDVSKAHDALDTLFLVRLDSTTAAMVRDSALKFYKAAGISAKDKGYAAFVVGQAFFQLKERATGCSYIRIASTIDPGDHSYATLLGQCN